MPEHHLFNFYFCYCFTYKDRSHLVKYLDVSRDSKTVPQNDLPTLHQAMLPVIRSPTLTSSPISSGLVSPPLPEELPLASSVGADPPQSTNPSSSSDAGLLDTEACVHVISNTAVLCCRFVKWKLRPQFEWPDLVAAVAYCSG